jgi:hypothetical protein
LFEGGENEEGTIESQSLSFGMMILRIFSEGEQHEAENATGDDCDSDSDRDSSSILFKAEVVS